MRAAEVRAAEVRAAAVRAAAVRANEVRANEVRAAAERAARTSYGRLVALLAAPTRDIALAEDALADAFEQALRSWPQAGVPDNPDAWLLTVARNRQRDVFKSAARKTAVALDETHSAFGGASEPLEATRVAGDPARMDPAMIDLDAIPDKRLELLFVCAHPAIEAAARTPLMLQTVLGVEAAQIARAFAIPPAAMAQRLVRAKRRIRDAGIPFAVPAREDMPARLDAVLEAIYGAYAIDWQGVSGETVRESLAAEALYLAVTLATLLEKTLLEHSRPDGPEREGAAGEAEALGLAALISHSMARTAARGTGGAFVALDEQDTSHWDAALISQGEILLRRASSFDSIGRFQLEAAIQSVHNARATSGVTDWTALTRFYGALVAMAPTLGSRVALAAAIGRADGPDAGLRALDAIDAASLARFQPAWATRAHLLAEAGRREDAAAAYETAISLAADPGIRAYLQVRRDSPAR